MCARTTHPGCPAPQPHPQPQPSRSQVLAGEERLSVRWDRGTDAVLFRVRSYSRPRHPFAVLGYPVVRLQQRRFARDAAHAMRRACTETESS